MEKIKQEILDSSSLPGLQKFIRNENKIIKLIWFLFLLFLASVSFYFIASNIISYYKYEFITNLIIIHDETPQFPMISLCIDTEQNTTLEIEQFLKSCKFDELNCTFKDFQQIKYINSIPDSSEICVHFNSGKNFYNQTVPIRNVSSSNTKFNLELYIKDFKSDVFGHKIPYKLLVYIQNHTNVFNAYEMYNIESGLEISAGINNIQIDREIDQKLSLPYNQCIKQDTNEYVSYLFQYFIQNNKTYKQKDCIDFCLNEYISQKCGCKVNNIDSLDKCLIRNDSQSKCISDNFDTYVLSKQFIPDYCFKYCPLECDSINYKIQMNSFKSSDTFLKTNTNYSLEMKDDLVFISIYYAKKSYDLITQIPKMQAFDLVSSVGGTLSLFVGVSFLTFVELIEIVMEIIIVYVDKIKLKNVKNKKINSFKPENDFKIVVDDTSFKFDSVAIRF